MKLKWKWILLSVLMAVAFVVGVEFCTGRPFDQPSFMSDRLTW